MNKKVFVVGDAVNYANFIDNYTLVDNIKDADIVIFTGGEDVSPEMYRASRHPSTFCNTERDKYEASIFKKVKSSQLVIGICRGSQFVCVMNGGKLVQDVSNHCIYSTHKITDGNIIYDITSTHHQMQYPYNLPSKDYTVLFKSCPNRSICYEGGCIDKHLIDINGEPEIVLYHKEGMPKCLAIQGHPEYMRKGSPVIGMINELINNNL